MKCPSCGQDYVPLDGQEYCSFCGKSLAPALDFHDDVDVDFSSSDQAYDFPSSESQESVRSSCPWEDMENLGFFEGLLQTLQQSLFATTKFFAKLPLRGGLLNPLLYALIVGTAGNMAAYLTGLATGGAIPFIGQDGLSGSMMVFIGLLIPPMILFTVFLWALILQGTLFLVGGANEDFEATFRVVCYTSAADLINAIPVLGGLIALVWKTYMTIIGLREVHRTSTGRAAAAVILPLVLCCGFVAAGLMLAFLGIGGSIG